MIFGIKSFIILCMETANNNLRQIQQNMAVLNSLFAKRVSIQQRLDKTESLNTFLFNNPGDELKELNNKINKLLNHNLKLSKEIEKEGKCVFSDNYQLVEYNETKTHGTSAMYGFRVQYSTNIK